ncbi:MAG: 4'-phosphopantetheinyl transferase superfamily protein, partial [Bacteroidetes bacterium]|nr:4'-phosphopantetheinyl transferase superfamily protein [Bacteroidota bacterium]
SVSLKKLPLYMRFSSAHQLIISDHTSVHLQSYRSFDNQLFEKQLNTKELEKLHSISNPVKKNEFVASRILKSALFPGDEILYNSVGAPFLKNKPETNISISHTTGVVGIAVSNHLIGMDLEPIRDLAMKIHSKFTNSYEKQLLDTNCRVEMTKAWSAKETLYKLAGRKEISFQNHMLIENVINDSLWEAKILKSDGWWRYMISFLESEGTILSINKDEGTFLE